MSDFIRNGRFLTYGMPAYILLACLYIALVFLLPASPETIHAYSLSNQNYRVLMFILAVPALFIWFVAFLSYSMLKTYANTIKNSKEGPYFDRLAKGTAWLAWSLPVTTIVALVLNSISYKYPDFRPTAVIVANYVRLVLPLIGFITISGAAGGLFNHAKLSFNLFSSRALTIFFVAVGVAYCYFTFRHFDLASLSSTSNPYYLPVWLMVISVTVPFLYAWFIGILACYQIDLYSRTVKGVFYRQSLRLLAVGLIIVVASLIALQYINSVLPVRGYLVLDSRIILTTAFRIFAAVGFGFIAMGALRLWRIEKV